MPDIDDKAKLTGIIQLSKAGLQDNITIHITWEALEMNPL
jgi:hypothetical protein